MGWDVGSVRIEIGDFGLCKIIEFFENKSSFMSKTSYIFCRRIKAGVFMQN